MKLLQDTTPRLLVDVYRTLSAHDRADFRETAHDFSCGLNSTIIGAASAMRLWVANPPSWIGDRRQQARIRFLAALDAAMPGHLQSAA